MVALRAFLEHRATARAVARGFIIDAIFSIIDLFVVVVYAAYYVIPSSETATDAAAGTTSAAAEPVPQENA